MRRPNQSFGYLAQEVGSVPDPCIARTSTQTLWHKSDVDLPNVALAPDRHPELSLDHGEDRLDVAPLPSSTPSSARPSRTAPPPSPRPSRSPTGRTGARTTRPRPKKRTASRYSWPICVGASRNPSRPRAGRACRCGIWSSPPPTRSTAAFPLGASRATCGASTRTALSQSPRTSTASSNYLSDPRLTAILKELATVSSLPLKAVETDFAVDATGFSTCTYERWRDAKYGGHAEARLVQGPRHVRGEDQRDHRR